MSGTSKTNGTMKQITTTAYRKVNSHGFVQRPGWCITHNDFAWVYGDGGVNCFYCCVVEHRRQIVRSSSVRWCFHEER